MVDRKELEKTIKEKILLTGETATGKTYTAVKIAELIAKAGKKVVFIDPEYGSEREMELLSDEILSYIDLRVTPNWVSLKEAIERKDMDCFVKIVDGLSEAFVLLKIYLEDRYSARGKYQIGESQVEIADKEIFTLPYQAFSKVYDGVRELCGTMLNHTYHFICTMHPLVGEKSTAARKELEASLLRKFDTVMLLRRVEALTPKPHLSYEAVLMKHRGRPFTAFYVMSDYINQLTNVFNRRLGIKETVLEEVKT